MRSIRLHLLEKTLYTFLFLLFGVFICLKINFSFMEQFHGWDMLILYGLFIACFGLAFFIYCYFKRWKHDGFTLSKKLGLKRLIIFQTNLVTPTGNPVFELHHRPYSVKYGLKLKKYPKRMVVDELKKDLIKDFEILSFFCQNKRAHLITVTHSSMAHIWKTTSQDYFNVVGTEVVKDPFVKPNWLQWVILSLSTTGRVSPKPKKWSTFVFNAVEGGD